jgi:predicted RNase H-like nuclease
MLLSTPTQISGVDCCKAGRWIAVTAILEAFDKAEVKVFENVADLISELAPRSIIAIDVPIGLPERAIGGGREPDWVARAFLGPRKASVFPVPSRRVVYAYEYCYEEVCTVAQETSDPPKKPSQQVFGIFPRIQQIDVILRQDPVLRERIFEVHPEVSFQVMNNERPLLQPKKFKGRIHEPGMRSRRNLLTKGGFAASFLNKKPPRGAEWDDFYDACACAWSAKRILFGTARVFPSHPPLDEAGLRQAIRA